MHTGPWGTDAGAQGRDRHVPRGGSPASPALLLRSCCHGLGWGEKLQSRLWGTRGDREDPGAISEEDRGDRR